MEFNVLEWWDSAQNEQWMWTKNMQEQKRSESKIEVIRAEKQFWQEKQNLATSEKT